MSSFSLRYDAATSEIERKLGDLIDQGASFDLERNGDVLKIEYEDGESVVITPQEPTGQLWISADYAGHRFNFSEEAGLWLSEREGEGLNAFLSRTLSAHLGEEIEL